MTKDELIYELKSTHYPVKHIPSMFDPSERLICITCNDAYGLDHTWPCQIGALLNKLKE